jgi:hypothetical protein
VNTIKCAISAPLWWEDAILSGEVPVFEANVEVVSCHHSYVAWEHHYGENVLTTEKGAVRAREGDMGIIPGSMGDQIAPANSVAS